MALLEDQIEEAQAAFVAAHEAKDAEGAQVLADHLRDLQAQKAAVDKAAQESSESQNNYKNPLIAAGAGAAVGATVNPVLQAIGNISAPSKVAAPPPVEVAPWTRPKFSPGGMKVDPNVPQDVYNWMSGQHSDVPVRGRNMKEAERLAQEHLDLQARRADFERKNPGKTILDSGVEVNKADYDYVEDIKRKNLQGELLEHRIKQNALNKAAAANQPKPSGGFNLLPNTNQPTTPFSMVKGGARGAITGASLADIPQQLSQGNYGTAGSDLGVAVGNVAHGLSRTPKGKAFGTLLGLGSGLLRGAQGVNELTAPPPEQRAHGGLIHLAGGGQPELGEARAYEPSYSEKIRDYAAKHIGREQANRLFGGANARFEDNFNPLAMALQTPGVIADSAVGFIDASKKGNYLDAMGNYLTGALNVAPMIKPGAQAIRKYGPKIAEAIPKFSGGSEVIKAVGKNLIKLPSAAFKAAPEQTVTDPLRNAFSGIYKRPDIIASEAAARVAPESDALKRLFGVTRDDLYQMGKGRVGNISGVLPGAAANPKGSKAAISVMNPRNEQRLLDVLSESEKHPELVRGMDPWYIMDPAYKRLEELVGPEEAVKKYRQLNTLTGMASPGSDVLTEMNRGPAANYLATQGRFDDFVNYAGLPFGARGAGFPEDLRAVMGHPYHKTAQATPMQKYLESGQVQMSSPKVPMYIDASGVPQTGFQTDMPVGDAHWSRAVGLADTRGTATRKGKEVVPGASVSNPEMSQLGPWWKDKIAAEVGLESVPAQARAWGAFSPQTGVESPIGAPKLELLSMKIMEAANRMGIPPEQARDLILKGEAYAGKKEGGLIESFDTGGRVGIAKKLFDEAQAAYKAKFTPGFYHGSPAPNIKTFDPLKSTVRDTDFVTPGVTFVTRSPKFADSFTNGKGPYISLKTGDAVPAQSYTKGATMYPVSVDMSNHFDPMTPEGFQIVRDYTSKKYANDPEMASQFKSRIQDPHSNWTTMESPSFLQHLRDTGHTSFAVNESGYPNVGVLNPSKIRGKFAEFNPEEAASADFMKAEGGAVQNFQAGGLAALAKSLAKHPHGQNPKVAQALEEYLKGNISQEERIRIMNQILPMRQWNELPPKYTDEQIRNALLSNKQSKALAPVPAGMQVGNRLDIPAYTQHGVYVDTTHDTAGKPISYNRTGHLTGVDFSSKPNQAVRVGLGTKEQALTPMGAEMGAAKSPFALIKGTNVGTSDDEVRRMMTEMMKDPSYTQIGMDPRKHSQFYDKSTGMPVWAAEEKLQSGPLILAPRRGLETTSWDDPRLNLNDFPGKKYASGGKV